jgi:hypothetical protein
LPTSQLSPSGLHQVRLSLDRATVARLLDLQGRMVASGRRKPSYSELLGAAVAYISEQSFGDIAKRLEGSP